VAVGSLVPGDPPRTVRESPEHVRALAGAPGELPPIIVHRATMRVVDGLHRLRAVELRGQEFIAARMFDGDESDAFILAVQANLTSGLPLSVADRKAAALRIVTSHPHWSDRMIASASGLSARPVAEVRRSHPAPTALGQSRVGRDGRVRPVNAAEKRRMASELFRRNPDLSLRQVARAVGISPETARSVRNRLTREGQQDPSGTVRPDGPARTDESIVAAGRRGSPAADVGRTAAPVDRAEVIRRLRVDPALRYSDDGRALLRLLQAHALSDEQWTALLDSVPAHRRGTLAHVALDCSRVWLLVARMLGRNAPHSV
jgi:ParB-like chromosome segregation protein Spo0J